MVVDFVGGVVGFFFLVSEEDGVFGSFGVREGVVVFFELVLGE